jgi:hypothetical protein
MKEQNMSFLIKTVRERAGDRNLALVLRPRCQGRPGVGARLRIFGNW